MLYKQDAKGSVTEAVERLKAAAKDVGFGVVGIVDMRGILDNKHEPIDFDCVVVEICHPRQARQILEESPEVSSALPCRVSVFEADGQTWLAAAKPTDVLNQYDLTATGKTVAIEVEQMVVRIIDTACA
jgi:uncharacterized protein (DUF302 family)